MYKIRKYSETLMIVTGGTDGETIESKVQRLVQDKEPIKDGAPLIFTERSQGVNAAYNIRTDRFEIAVDAMSRLLASKQAKRDELIKKAEDKEAKVIEMKDGKAEPTPGKVADNKQSS